MWGAEPAFVAVERNVVGQSSGAGPAGAGGRASDGEGELYGGGGGGRHRGDFAERRRPVYEVLLGAPEREVSEQVHGSGFALLQPAVPGGEGAGAGEVKLVDPAGGTD
jgi:hypothetical protein